MTGGARDPAIVPFRGDYLVLPRERRGARARQHLSGPRSRAAVPRRALHAAPRRLGVARPQRRARVCARRLPFQHDLAARPRADARVSGLRAARRALLAHGDRRDVSRPGQERVRARAAALRSGARGARLPSRTGRRSRAGARPRRTAGRRLRRRSGRARAARAQRAVARGDRVARDREDAWSTARRKRLALCAHRARAAAR